MTEQYQLVFSGEVLQGQHQAVVKRRLAGLLKLDDAKLARLFSGTPVVIKKSVDKATAAKYLAAFKKSGGALQVTLLAAPDSPEPELEPESKPEPESLPELGAIVQPASPSELLPEIGKASATASMDVLPVGADILSDNERADNPVVEVNTDHLQVDDVGAVLQPAGGLDSVPVEVSVDHISVADVGETLGEETEVMAAVEVDEHLFDVAEVGTIMGDLGRVVEPVIDPNSVNFDVAQPGAILDTAEKAPPPQAPTTDHIEIKDD